MATHPENPGSSRRAFLARSGGGLLFFGLGGLSGLFGGCELHGEIARRSGQARSFVTPTEGGLDNDFYLQFGHNGTTLGNHPRIADDAWELVIDGAVGSRVPVRRAELVGAADSITLLKTMRCVFDAPGVPYISNGYWEGVPLARFLADAVPAEGARRLFIHGADGFTTNLPIERVTQGISAGIDPAVPLPPVLLAYALNGAPIPTEHGGPVRLIVPEKFGYKNMKWPTFIEVKTEDTVFGEYELQLFHGDPLADAGNIGLTALFTAPLPNQSVQGPSVTFFGVGLYGAAGVARVEVSIDGGDFQAADVLALDEVAADPALFFDLEAAGAEADLAGELASLRAECLQLADPTYQAALAGVWSIWRLTAELGKGGHQVRVRAVGTDGAVQPDTDTESADGDSSVRVIRFTVV